MFDQPIDLLEPQDRPVVSDDRSAASPPPETAGRPDGFQIPGSIWICLFACYGVFIVALALAAGGSGPARLVLAISAFFMLAYFGTVSILARQGDPDREQADRAKPLQTIYGPLDIGAVRAQILTVPITVAAFGVAMLIIASMVMD